jgi:exostosin family protein
MAAVFLLTTTAPTDHDYNRGAYYELKTSAEAAFRHTVTLDANAADVILFAELYGAGPFFERVRRHALVKRFREKCFLFCSNDFVIPFLPGVYASIEKHWASARTRSGFYLAVSINPFANFTPPHARLPHLYSFIGSFDTAPLRRDIRTMQHRRALICDSAREYQIALNGKFKEGEEEQYWRRYADAIKMSKFVLCPRGLGVSSVRLFDTMRMGRAPVILSDDWIEPLGPSWNSFSMRVPENDLRHIPSILEEREAEAVQMGLRARAEWERWFSPQVAFETVVDWCLHIQANRRLPERWARFLPYIQYLRPFHFRHFLRTRVQQWKQPAAVKP